MQFRAPTLQDRGEISRIVAAGGQLGCEYCFGNILMYSGEYGTGFCFKDGFFVSKENRPVLRYIAPVGDGSDADFATLIRELIDDSRENGHPFQMHRVDTATLDRIQRLFPDSFEATPERDDFDYIYNRTALAELSGKKYHAKRNFITRFTSDFGPVEYEEITPATIPECMEICERWHDEQAQRNPFSSEELKALKIGFDNYTALGFTGGLIRVGGKAVAFTFGEAINPGCFVTHAEKTLPEYRDAYPVINNYFARNSLCGYELVNREEDMGMEGLRTAKLSYHPALLYEKYIIRERGQ